MKKRSLKQNKASLQPKWWSSNYTLQEKLQFVYYRLHAPKSISREGLPHILPVGTHTLSPLTPNYTMTFLGDIMPSKGRTIVLSDSLQACLTASDAVVVNLEGVITNQQRAFALTHDHHIVHFIRGLTPNQVIVNVANNHSSDFGSDAFEKQMQLLLQEGFQVLGCPHYEYLVHQQVLLYAASYWSNQKIDTSLRFSFEKVLDAPSGNATFNLFLPHWGYEMELHPHPKQVLYAQQLLQRGWDGIIGNHSHCPQSMQLIDNKLVAYSLGNFCYANANPNHWFGLMVQLQFHCAPAVRPTLTHINTFYTLQEQHGENLIIKNVEELSYKEIRKHLYWKWNWAYYKDLLF